MRRVTSRLNAHAHAIDQCALIITRHLIGARSILPTPLVYILSSLPTTHIEVAKLSYTLIYINVYIFILPIQSTRTYFITSILPDFYLSSIWYQKVKINLLYNVHCTNHIHNCLVFHNYIITYLLQYIIHWVDLQPTYVYICSIAIHRVNI